MLEAKGKVIGTDARGTRVRFHTPHCSSCGGCGSAAFAEVTLGDVGRDAVVAKLPTGTMLAVLLHSLGLPILGFAGGAAVAAGLGVTDLAAVLLCAAGLAAGVVLCRPQSLDRILIEEVSNE